MVTLISVDITAFGNLSNYHYTFDSGMNSILGDNSIGKTTLLGFIRCMFYGLYDKKYLKIDKQRDMYRPWNLDKKATLGGSMQFSWDRDGTPSTYRITRQFGSTPKADSSQLVNIDSGDMWENIDNLGEQVFGFNVETFERSIFVHQEQTTITGDSGELNAKLSRMVDGKGDHTIALAKLDNARKTFVLNGNKGNNNVLLAEIDKQQYQLQVATNNLHIAQQKTCQLSQAQADKQQCVDNLATLRQQQAELSVKVAVSPQQQTNQQKLAEAKQLLSHAEWADIDKHYDELTWLVNANPTTAKGKLPTWAVLVTILVAMAVGIVLALTVQPWLVVVPIVLAVLVLVCVKPTVLVDNSQQIHSILSIYLPLSQCQNTDDALSRIYDIRSSIHNARATVEVLSSTSIEDNSLAKKQMNHVLASIAQCESQIDTLSTNIGMLTADIDNIYQHSNVAEIQEQIQVNKDKWQLCNYRYNIVTTLQDIVNTTKKQMSLSYLPELSRTTSELLCGISSQLWQQVSISDKFELTILDNGVLRDIKYFSCGTRELVLFCYRVALSIKLYGGNLPLLLVDDAFVNLDDNKFTLAMQVLDNLAKQQGTQIVYVSCHGARHGKK